MKARHGFTLLEMSIVIVIISLVMGGIFAGQSLLRASRLSRVASQLTEFRAAYTGFREKFGAFPGDMPNATGFWGAANTDPSTCEVTASADQKTCNGNGDGLINRNVNTATSSEKFRMWQHLANAGLIKGTYTGTAADSQYRAIPGIDVPKGPLPNTGFSASQGADYSSDPNTYPLAYGNALDFGTATALSETSDPALIPEEAMSIDTKMDDGKPGSGFVLSWKAGGGIAPNCATTADPLTAKYNVSLGTPACSLLFRLGAQN